MREVAVAGEPVGEDGANSFGPRAILTIPPDKGIKRG